MKVIFEKKFEATIELLHKHIPVYEGKEKPIIPHLLRVGKFLYEYDCSDEVIQAGLLHDIIEWGDIDSEKIKKMYGPHVCDIVLANTKNRKLSDPHERRIDYVQRCADVGVDALVVKAADVLDSYRLYSKKNNASEIERCKDIGELVLEHAKKFRNHPVLNELRFSLEIGQ